MPTNPEGFSPVAGIQWVETNDRCALGLHLDSFSPVAGIQWVETYYGNEVRNVSKERFSPVAGIQWVETFA